MGELVLSHSAHLALQSVQMALEVLFGGKVIFKDSIIEIPKEKKLFEHYNIVFKARFKLWGNYEFHKIAVLVPLYKFGINIIVKENPVEMLVDDEIFIVSWKDLKDSEVPGVRIVKKYPGTATFANCVMGSGYDDRVAIARKHN